MKPVLSIIIVTYNHQNEIGYCLESIHQHVPLKPIEIIVVDNDSRDLTVTEIEKQRRNFAAKSHSFQLVRNAQNYGFTVAINQGLMQSNGRFILFLNPDTQITAQCVESMVQFLSNHPDAGAVAPQLRYPDGRTQPSCRRFPRYRFLVFEVLGLNRLFAKNRIFNGWKMGDFDHQSMRAVDQPQGACLLVRGNILKEIGELDRRFIMFFSDVDLCARIWEMGYKVYFYPNANIIHNKGSSVYPNRTRMIWISHWDFIRYFLKWYRSPIQMVWNIFGIPFLFLVGTLRWGFYKTRTIPSGYKK